MIKLSLRLIAFCFALTLSTLALAQDTPEGNVIRLSSTGEVKVEPNMATITLAVTTQSKTADAAIKDNAKNMDQVVKALKAKLAANDTLQTSQFQLRPVYQTDRDNNQSKIVGYRVSNQITIEYHNLATLGNLLDAVVDNGINQIDNLRFSHTDSASLQKKALDQAITQGKATAELIAQSAGVKIKGIKEIQAFDSHPAPVYREAVMAMDARGAGSQVQPGEITISSNVSLVFAIN
jgi:uncharacterized protein YggE